MSAPRVRSIIIVPTVLLSLYIWTGGVSFVRAGTPDTADSWERKFTRVCVGATDWSGARWRWPIVSDYRVAAEGRREMCVRVFFFFFSLDDEISFFFYRQREHKGCYRT